MAVPMMSHYIAGLNDIVDELRYQAVLVFIVVVCCYCFVMANMVKYSEIVHSLMSVFFCGGSCVEDVTSHLMRHLS